MKSQQELKQEIIARFEKYQYPFGLKKDRIDAIMANGHTEENARKISLGNHMKNLDKTSMIKKVFQDNNIEDEDEELLIKIRNELNEEYENMHREGMQK